jgi:phospholipase/carboxylesterase
MPVRTTRQSAPETAQLSAKPHEPRQAGSTGLERLLLRNKRGALLYVPPAFRAGALAPLAVMLHGAGGNAEHGLHLLRSYADNNGMILLAPESRKTTWDIIVESQYGPDVAFINDCLSHVFDRYAVDPKHIALGGFSDGASYALSLGLSNGQLFTHIIAFSPGFMAPVRVENKIRIFVSHGTEDNVLPIQSCSRKIVPILKRGGFAVEYHEFEGPHTIPADISRRAVEWFTPES